MGTSHIPLSLLVQSVGADRKNGCLRKGKRMRLAALTGGVSVPSSRLRVRQYIPALRGEGINVEEFVSGFGSYPPRLKGIRPLWAAATLTERLSDVVKSHRYDAVLLQRELMS